jgi:nucleoside 2-deoxyribosyltransferase
MLEQIQGQYLKELETMFIVFDPLAIADMPLTYDQTREAMPELIDKITSKDKETIKKRTIVRDFQFIDRCDAVVVFYLTDKVSPGVLAEIYYAHRNQTPVFMVFNGSKSPFIEDATTCIEPDINSLMDRLRMFASLQSDPLGVEPLSLDALPEGTP